MSNRTATIDRRLKQLQSPEPAIKPEGETPDCCYCKRKPICASRRLFFKDQTYAACDKYQDFAEWHKKRTEDQG